MPELSNSLNINPYAASDVDLRPPEARPAIENAGSQITARIINSVEYLDETLQRYRTHASTRYSNKLRYVNGMVVVAAGLFVILVLAQLPLLIPLLLVVVLMVMFPERIGDCLTLMQQRLSSRRNEEISIVLGDEGLLIRSNRVRTKHDWWAYCEPVEFPDGVLVFHGERIIHWIPFSSLENKSDEPILYDFIASRIRSGKVACETVV
jgi:hypothetical protein